MRRSLVILLIGLLALGGFGLAGPRLAGERQGAVVHRAQDSDTAAEGTEEAIEEAEEIAEEAADATEDAIKDARGDDDVTVAAGVSSDPVATDEVRMAGETFTPAVITIEVGQTVTFINDDHDEHTATGTTFDTGTLQPGDSATVTFDRAGTFDYICQFHADMRGQVIVTGPAGTGTPNATAQASPVARPATGATVAATSSGQASPVASPTAGVTTAAASSRIKVNIVDFAFEATSLTVPPSTTVVWTNTGAAPHTVTGDFADSGIIDPGQTYEWTFTAPGTFAYVCALHPQMVGEVIVDPDASPLGNA